MATINTRIKLKRDTTAHWNAATGFIPLAGEVIIYTDYRSENGTDVPGMKVGDGQTYVQDLPFQSGVTHNDILFWDDKINIDDSGETNAGLPNNTLVFSRTYVSSS